jgi:F-box and WD-40 domain protein MET30
MPILTKPRAQELDKLPSNHQQAISQIWSVFSASPAKIREIILDGIMTQCCFPQLSRMSREVHEQLKIDFIAVLPAELSLRILCYLDPVSLCKAAQVSHKWKMLADDDLVWHNQCKQHIDKKCTSCGWGLPLLEAKRVRQWSRPGLPAINLQQAINNAAASQSSPEPKSSKRPLAGVEDDRPSKRVCSSGSVLPWKEVYRDRFRVGTNWKYGRCSIKIFNGHSNGVTCLQFRDNILATGSYDSTIKIWDIETGQEVRTLVGHASGIRALQFDDKKLISGSLDHTIKIWDWQSGECVNTMTCHTDSVISVHFDGKWLASGSIDRSVKLFNFETRHTFCLRGHKDWVNHVRLDLHSRTVFSASDDCTIKLWDMDTRQCLQTYVGHLGQVQQLLLMPDDFEPELEGQQCEANDAVSVSSGRCSTPAAATQAQTHVQDHMRSLTPMPDDRTAFGPAFEDPARSLPPRYMLTAGLDNTLRLWEVSTGKCIRTMFGHLEGIWGLAGDTLRVVTGAHDSSVKVWDPRSGKCQRTFTGHSGAVTCVGLDDHRLASGSEDGEVRIYTFMGEPSSLEECGTPA